MKSLKYFILLTFIVHFEIFSAKISPLNNQTYLLTSGSHGLRITHFGQAYIYSGSWTHIFHIKFPKILFENYKLPRPEFSCDDSHESIVCKSFSQLINNTINVTTGFNEMLHKKFSNVLDQQIPSSWTSRRKRSLFPFFGEALGYFFGTASKTDLNDIKDKFEILSKKLSNSDENTVILKNELIGLSEIVQKRTERVNKVFESIGQQLSEVSDELDEHFRHISILKNNAKLSLRIDDSIISTIIEMYNLVLYSLTVEDLEEALIQMRRGLLPSNLITPEVLKTILKKVQKSVRPLYTIGITDKNIDFYYILPLIRFSIVENGILLKLSIPLQTIETQTEFNLLKAMSNPIPCNYEFCLWKGRIDSSDIYLTLSLKERAWLTDKDNIDILGEVDLSTLSCITISGINLCYTLDRSLIQTTTICTKSLWIWDNSFIKNHCSFEISLKENYQPIRMSENSWILHKSIINNYDIICEQMGAKSGARSRLLTDWAEQVTVNENCYLRTDNYKLYGPLKERDNRLDTIPAKSPIFIFDNSFEKTKVDYNEIDNSFGKKSKEFKRLDTNEINDYLALDQKAITTVVDRIYTFADKMDSEMNVFHTERQNTNNFISWQTTINSLTKCGLFFTITVILIIFIRMGNGIYGIAPIIIAEIDRAEATRITARDTVYLWDSLTNDPFNFSLNLSLLICGIILFYAIHKFKFLRSMTHTIHYCNIEREFIINHLIISFQHTNYWSINPYIREIIIQFPIDCMNNLTDIRNIQIIGQKKVWQILQRDEKIIFRILSPVKLLVESQGTQMEKHQTVEIEMNQLNWMNGGRPRNMKAWNTYGDCNLSLYREMVCSSPPQF